MPCLIGYNYTGNIVNKPYYSAESPENPLDWTSQLLRTENETWTAIELRENESYIDGRDAVSFGLYAARCQLWTGRDLKSTVSSAVQNNNPQNSSEQLR